MIVYNTRFNPTCNGDPNRGSLHPGHICMCLINEYEAHSTGGKFIVRFDDTQEYWNDRLLPGELVKIKDGMKYDLEWMGLQVDAWESQSELADQAMEMIDHLLPYRPIPVPGYVPSEGPEDESQPGIAQYPYTDFYTLEKVCMDFIEEANLLIRGEELKSEFSLYCHYTHLLRLPPVRQVFLPRLWEVGEIDGRIYRDMVSKTTGKLPITGLRQRGIVPSLILSELRAAYLKDKNGPWSIRNVRPDPVLERGLL